MIDWSAIPHSAFCILNLPDLPSPKPWRDTVGGGKKEEVAESDCSFLPPSATTSIA
jgi:hypothetical protein